MGNRIKLNKISKTLAIILLVSNIWVLPVQAKPGTQEDPLVTKAYVDTYISSQLSQGNEQLADLASRLEDQQKRLDALRVKLNPFKDTKGHWALESILYLRVKGIISGFEDGTFRPNGQVTRAQLAAMLVRAREIKTGKGTGVETGTETSKEASTEARQVFKDVPLQHWAYREITTAKTEGIISGYPDGTFAPNQPVTREQIAAMIIRAFPAEASLPNPNFTDIRQSWAKESIVTLARAGIIGGYPDNTFAPKKSATRAEVSIILTRALEPNKRIKK